MVLAVINRGLLWLLIVAVVMFIIAYSTRRENRKESRKKKAAAESRDHMPHEAQIWEDDEWSVQHRARPDGFTPEEAKLWRDAGYTAREARRLSQEHEAPPPRSD